MSYLCCYFPNQKPLRLRCECCRANKDEPNGERRCNTCIELGCTKKVCGSYKRAEKCPYRKMRKKNSSRAAATRAWTEREKAEKR